MANRQGAGWAGGTGRQRVRTMQQDNSYFQPEISMKYRYVCMFVCMSVYLCVLSI